MRAAWNSYLADYVLANSTCSNRSVHASRISDYKDKNGGNILNNNVRVVTYRILTGHDYSTFGCNECAEALQSYLADTSTSSALYSSGSAMYDSFAMAACASQDPNFDSENQTYASYFSEYMGQMDAVYSAVESAIGNLESAGKSYIVISVSSNYGIVKCEVLPATANPRQD